MKVGFKKIAAVFLLPFLLQLSFAAVHAQKKPEKTPPTRKIQTPNQPDSRARSLLAAVNKYRRDNDLSEIPASRWLTEVARKHTDDLETNKPEKGACSMHSWSDKGTWSACCYKLSSPSAKCMQNKPREISQGAFAADGFEIVVTFPGRMTEAIALEEWKRSKAHANVILNRGAWKNFKWKAAGASISEHYAVVWFAAEPDESR